MHRVVRARPGPRGASCAVVALLWVLLVVALASPSRAQAGTLTRADLEVRFPAPLVVGERDKDMPAFPIFLGSAGGAKLVAWVFESIDIAPIPGFSGTAPNLLIALGPDGAFVAVQVLSHHEPVFLDGLGEEPLHRFVLQYAGKTLGQPVKVGSNINSAEKNSSSAVYIDGVAKATASILIINQTILASATRIARAKLGLGGGGGDAPASAAFARRDIMETFDWPGLQKAGLVARWAIDNAHIETAFRKTAVEGIDATGLQSPDARFVEIYVADPLVPSVGRALLGAATFEKLSVDLAREGHRALLLLSTGRWGVQGTAWTPGSVPDRVVIRQAGLPIVARDLAFDGRLALRDAPRAEVTLLKIPAQAGFDPASPFELVAHVTREKGQIYPERVARDFTTTISWPGRYYERPSADEARGSGLWTTWRARGLELSALAVALIVLGVALAKQRAFTANPGRFDALRLAFLVFTLLFIGWYAQAQLSIVTLIGVVKAAAKGGDLTFLLWDPPSLVLWSFTLVTLVVWGRGTFCGWLCPFGALQELSAAITRRLALPQIAVSERLDRWLRMTKYAVLGLLIVAALSPAGNAEALAEVEPFKTSITLLFVRTWPFVVYAVALIVLNLFVYKAFCRYLCPLGALFALGGRLRRFDWIPRRAQCGSPCQLCETRCRYGAISKRGHVDYAECFQCLDCVSIYHDAATCVPLVQAARGKAVSGAGDKHVFHPLVQVR